MQPRNQGGFYIARKPHTLHGSPLAARELPNRQYVKYAHALDPRVLELLGYITFCKTKIKPSELSSKGLNIAQFPGGAYLQTPLGCARSAHAKPRSVHRHCRSTSLVYHLILKASLMPMILIWDSFS